MGFHKRRISNKLIRYCFVNNGIDSLKELLFADAIIAESGIAYNVINEMYNERVCWFKIEKMIYDDIYNKGSDMLSEEQKINIAVILSDSSYSRDGHLMEIKSYLSYFKNEFDVQGIEYTYLASQIIKEYYEVNGTRSTTGRV
jgi:hypothetical protein